MGRRDQPLQDFQYVMQDVSRICIGVKYTLEGLASDKEVNFKLRMIVRTYLMRDVDPQTTLESQLYYLERGTLEYEVYEQLRVKLLVYVADARHRGQYQERVLSLEQLTLLSPAQKKQMSMVIREIRISKLALAGFSL